MSNRPRAPLFVTVNITGYCNLSCKYCYFRPRSFEHMSWNNYKKIIDQLAEQNVFFINLSGGEPFTHPHFNKFLRYAHSKFQYVEVLTNGTILDLNHIETIKKIVRKKGSFPIQISIDSIFPEINQKTRNDPSKTLHNIKIFNQIGATIVIAIVITRFNASSILDTIKRLSIYAKHFHIMNVQKVDALENEDKNFPLKEEDSNVLWKKISSLKNELGLYIEIPNEEKTVLGCAYGASCMGGYSHIVIDPDLRVRPCDKCVTSYIGDLNHETIHDIWNGPAIKEILNNPIPICQIKT